jgi:hypothetical protein
MNDHERDMALRGILQDVGGVGLALRVHMPTSGGPNPDGLISYLPQQSAVWVEYLDQKPGSPAVHVEAALVAMAADTLAHRLVELRQRYGVEATDEAYEGARRKLAEAGITNGYHILIDEPISDLGFGIQAKGATDDDD